MRGHFQGSAVRSTFPPPPLFPAPWLPAFASQPSSKCTRQAGAHSIAPWYTTLHAEFHAASYSRTYCLLQQSVTTAQRAHKLITVLTIFPAPGGNEEHQLFVCYAFPAARLPNETAGNFLFSLCMNDYLIYASFPSTIFVYANPLLQLILHARLPFTQGNYHAER
jgi:hypothetical protein